MLCEVGEVLSVESRKRKVIDQTARCDPSVVLWPRSAALLSSRLKLPPLHSDRLVILQDRHPLPPPGQTDNALGSPVPQGTPLGQFPIVTNVMHIVCPANTAFSRSGSRFRSVPDATSVSSTIRLTAG